MNKLTKKLMIILGFSIGITSVLVSIPAAFNQNYLLLGLCITLIIASTTSVAIAID